MTAILKDRLSLTDNKSQHVSMPSMKPHGLWARTKIMASNDEIVLDKNGVFSHFAKKIPTGKSALGETIFRKERVAPKWTESNMVPIGGCQFAMELLYGVPCDQIHVPSLYEQSGNLIGLPDAVTTASFDIPGGTKTAIYNHGNFVQLFGIGITGTAENDITVPKVDYRENSININRVTNDGLTLTGTMVPFRYTSEVLKDAEKLQYFGKKNEGDGITGYYLKKFDSDPVIKHIWKTGEDVENETEVSDSDVWSNTSGSNTIESFTECILKITKEDVKEWFISLGQEDRARINTIALFTGQYVKSETDVTGDYRDVRMFSKLNIPVEHLSLTKDLNLVYRVYTA